jgi:hypothetical protein
MDTFAIFRDFCLEYEYLFTKENLVALVVLFGKIFDMAKNKDVDDAEFLSLLLARIPIAKNPDGFYYLDSHDLDEIVSMIGLYLPCKDYKYKDGVKQPYPF